MATSKTVQHPHARSAGRPLLRRPAVVYGTLGGVVLVTALVLVLASVVGSGSKSTPSAASALTAPTLFDGIAQSGAALGSPRAPVTLVEYADVQCPFCGQWARNELPAIVSQFVRTGRVRIEFHGLAFVGPESLTGLAGAVAAGRQNRLWNFLDVLYTHQGAENSGWVDSTLDAAGAAAGLDQARWNADRSSDGVSATIQRLSSEAAALGVTSTPSFAIGRTGGTREVLSTHSLDVATLSGLATRLTAGK